MAAISSARSRLALDKDGRFLALEVRAVANMGAYLSTSGPISSTNAASSAIGGVYDIPSVFFEVRGAFTNTPPIDAYRGAGKPEANYLIERLVNLASIRTGIDAIKLRRRNIIRKFPHRTAMGMKIDGGRFGANLDDAIALADLDGFRKRRKQSAKAGLLRGIGIACFLETARGVPTEFARAAFEADGTVSLAVGTQSNGQGHETVLSPGRGRPVGIADRRIPFPTGRHRSLAGRSWPWRRAIDAYGRHRAGDGG